ncbi:hypothetical protein PHLCEN_2v13132 [Hermanssonia centrifuga]|uniref:Uncharacterized protein n=1 Tax=Hermanssonia centrifuga TaxID=98765 RepID=A0A2R6NFD2_9APHY|nr:hypothetical protein PHLCEN_2v13132 [Hermanssonia centrifuga]
MTLYPDVLARAQKEINEVVSWKRMPNFDDEGNLPTMIYGTHSQRVPKLRPTSLPLLPMVSLPSQHDNIQFRFVAQEPAKIRVAFEMFGRLWLYVGTDCDPTAAL